MSLHTGCVTRHVPMHVDASHKCCRVCGSSYRDNGVPFDWRSERFEQALLFLWKSIDIALQEACTKCDAPSVMHSV